MKCHVALRCREFESTGRRAPWLRVDVVDSATGADVERAIDRALRSPRRRWLAHDGEPLSTRSAPVASALGRGTAIADRMAPPDDVGSVAEIEVVRGPDRGERIVCPPGLWRIGGTPDDDVTLLGGGLPAGAAVLALDRGGKVEIRRAVGVDGGDRDPVFGSPSEGRRIVGSLHDAAPVDITLDDHRLRVRRWVPQPERPGPDGTVAVRPRRRPPLATEPAVPPEVPGPPDRRRGRMFSLATVALPVASGVGMAALFGSARFLLLALLAPVILGLVALVDRVRFGRSFAREQAAYERELDTSLTALRRAAAHAVAAAHRRHPTVGALAHDVSTVRRLLWSRDPAAPDPLAIRVGTADPGVVVSVGLGSGGDRRRRAELEERLAEAGTGRHPSPVTVSLAAESGLAIAGDRAVAIGLAQAVAAQAVGMQSPQDLTVTVCASPADRHRWLWLERVPHRPRPGAVHTWPDDIARHLADLADGPPAHPNDAARHLTLVVVDGRSATEPGAVAALASRADVRVVWVGDDVSRAPAFCSASLSVTAEAADLVTSGPTGVERAVTFVPEPAEEAVVEAIADGVAGLRDATGSDRGDDLPAHVDLEDIGLEPAAVGALSADAPAVSLAAPIGRHATGIATIDLVADGPHLLVAGTTGSGKSEFLQTLLLGLAARHPPDRATIAFVDFKGGALADQMADLPHVVGSITNLDGAGGTRALRSLRAELERRMRILKGRAMDLAAFERLAPDECPPRLILVVDEFAALAREVPDVLGDLVDLARRGRSLGLHLVLATQRPSGVVSDQILANVDLRVAFRMLDSSDGRSLVGSDGPARIPPERAGRAVIQIGGRNTTVQTAWAGAEVARGEVEAARARLLGVADREGDAVGADDDETQGCRLISAIAAAHPGSRPAPPWCPPLPRQLSRDRLPSPHPGAVDRLSTRLGMIDDPDHQRQTLATVDLTATGGLVVVGGPGTGRTTTVVTALADPLTLVPPSRLEVSVLAPSRAVAEAWAAVPHVRGAASVDDLDGLAAEIDRLHRLVIEDPAGDAHRILVIDPLGPVRAALENAAGLPWWQRLLRLVEDGRLGGLVTIATTSRRAEVPSSVLPALAASVEFSNGDPSGLPRVGSTASRTAKRSVSRPGCGRLDDGSELQVARLDDGLAELARIAAGHGEGALDPPHRLGEHVRADDVVPLESWRPAIGIDERGDVVALDLRDDDVLVVGPPGSGRTNVLATLTSSADRWAPEAAVVHVDGRTGTAEVRRHSGAVTAVPIDAVDALVQLAGRAAGPTAGPTAGRPAGVGAAADVVVFVDDATRLPERAGAPLAALVDAARARVVAAVDVRQIGRSYTGWLASLRRQRRAVFLKPADAVEIEAVTGVRTRLRPDQRMPAGRAVVHSHNGLRTFQVYENA